MTSCGRLGLSLTDHSGLAPYCYLVHVRPCKRKLAATTDRCERQLELRYRELQQELPLRLRYFDLLKYAGFSTLRYAGLASHAGDPSLCTQEVNQSAKSNKSFQLVEWSLLGMITSID